VQDKPLRGVPPAEAFHGIAAHRGWRRDLRQKPAVRPVEPKLAVGLSLELVTLLVNGAVMPPTDHGEIRERGGAALRPVTDVMAVAEPDAAAWDAVV
jgi:hypothetical protein